MTQPVSACRCGPKTARKVSDAVAASEMWPVLSMGPGARRSQRGFIAIGSTYPGTTDELVKNILEQSGLKCGLDFLLAFSPEREDPGNRHFNTASIPKVVGGVDDDAAEVAVAMYVCFRQACVAPSFSTSAAVFASQPLH